MSTLEFTEAITKLQTELTETYKEMLKKVDPNNLVNDTVELQTKLAITTIESITNTIKTFRELTK
jgi:hypothetical protein|tara:strand:+ start:1378 stop:1572 length:195 start_codon:yes stop_codon:yes gene_type:complete